MTNINSFQFAEVTSWHRRRPVRRKKTISLTGTFRWKVLNRTPVARFFGQSAMARAATHWQTSANLPDIDVDDRLHRAEKSYLRWRRGTRNTAAQPARLRPDVSCGGKHPGKKRMAAAARMLIPIKKIKSHSHNNTHSLTLGPHIPSVTLYQNTCAYTCVRAHARTKKDSGIGYIMTIYYNMTS